MTLSPGRALLLSKVPEREWQQFIIGVAHRNGWMVSAMHDSRSLWWGCTAGFPDLTLVRGERLVFIECKSRTGRLGLRQKPWHAALKAAGAECYTFWPDQEDEVRAVLA